MRIINYGRCTELLRLDLGELDVAPPALGLGPEERRHRLGRAGEGIERAAREEGLRVVHPGDLVEPPRELVDDRARRAGGPPPAPPRREVEDLEAQPAERAPNR